MTKSIVLWALLLLPSEALAVRSVRIQCPGQGYQVVVTRHGLEGVLDYTALAGDSGQVYVPIQTERAPGLYVWDWLVRAQFPAWTPSGFFQTSLAPTVEWTPEAGERPWDYTVPADPWMVEILSAMKFCQGFYQSELGVSRGSLEVEWTDLGPSYTGSEDHINWPQDRNYFYSGKDSLSASQGVLWTMAHEMGHAIQETYLDPLPHCQVSECYHTTCAQGSGDGETSYSEGMADAWASLAIKRYVGRHPGIAPCSPPSMNREGSVWAFFFQMFDRDAKAVFRTMRDGRITFTQGAFRAKNLWEFYSLWNDFDPDPGWISNHSPGTFDAKPYWQYAVTGVISGVESGTKGWIERISPNPTSGMFEVRFRRPSTEFRLEVFDVAGRKVRCSQNVGWDSASFDLSKEASGIYFVRLLGKHARGLGKIVHVQ